MVLMLVQVTPVNAEPTPELFAYRIMSRSTVLKADTPIAYAFNERVDISDNMPYFEGTIAMVPARFMAESFNAEHEWEKAKGGRFVIEQRNCSVVHISVGKTITADGKEIKSDVLPVIKNGCLYVPAKAFAEAMRLSYKEDRETGLIFFSREDEEQRHGEVDYKKDFIPYFEATNMTNEKTYLFVATDGNDETGNGSKDNPFKTIDKAKEEVRKLTENQKGDIIVYLRGGTYQLSKEILFTPEDSGRNNFKVIYTAYEDEKPIIEGVKKVSGWTLYRGNIYVADVKGEDSIHYVYEDGRTAIKARHPNRDLNEPREGYLRSAGTSNAWYGISWNEGELPYIKNINDLEIFIWPGGTGGFWMWHSQISTLKDFNQKTRKMTMNVKASYEIGKGSRYYMMGAIEFLDAEGEFYHDKEGGKLYYIPYGYSIAGKSITIPTTDRLISFKGNSQTETVRNIEVSKIELRNTKRSTYLARYGGPRMARATGEGVRIAYAENCSVLECHIHDVGGNGVLAVDYFGNIKIDGNYIHDVGLGGVFFKTYSAFRSSNNIVTNNLVHATSRLLGQTIGIEISGGGDHIAKHNRVYDTVRSAMMFTDGQTGFTYMSYNDLSDANTAAEDTGVIYTMTQKKGTGSTVSNNFIHDSNAGFLSYSGIYSDEVSHSLLTQNNIITRMQTDGEDELGYYNAGIFAKGHDYRIINNVIANAGDESEYGAINIMDSHEIRSFGYMIERNITYNHGDVIYSTPNLTWNEKAVAYADKNVFFQEGTEGYKLKENAAKTLEDWKKLDGKGFEENSITEDPKFMNADKDDFRLRYDSPAKVLGIKTIKQSTIGLSENFRYADISDEISQLYISREGYSDTLSQINLRCGQTAALQVTARTKNRFVKKPQSIVYTSDNTSVASVSEDGVITANAAGKAKITATVQDGKSVSSIDIYAFVDDELIEFKFDKDAYRFETNKTEAIVPLGKTKFGQILIEDEFDELGFSIKDTSIANIDRGGYVHFTRKGTNEITATASFNGKTMTATTHAECVDYVITSIRLKMDSNTVKQGEAINVKVVGIDGNGNEVAVDGYECRILSLNESVAKVEQNGTKAIVSGVGAGKAQLKANVVWIGKTFEITGNVTVTVPNQLINQWGVSNYLNAKGFVIEDESGINIYSNGADIYRDEDDFTFVYREADSENLTVEATVLDVDDPVASITSTGVMLRQDDTAGSFNVNLRYLPWLNTAIITWRGLDTPNSKDVTIKNVKYHSPVKLRLEKKGDLIIASCMNKAGEWQVVQEVSLPLYGKYLAGVTSFSGNNGLWFNSKVTDVRIYEGAE